MSFRVVSLISAVPVVARHYSSSQSHTSQHFVWLEVCAGRTSIQEELLRLHKPILRAAETAQFNTFVLESVYMAICSDICKLFCNACLRGDIINKPF